MKTAAMTFWVGCFALGFGDCSARAEERLVATESFAYRGTLPLRLEQLGEAAGGWAGPWQAYSPLEPVFVDAHTINNPFGSGHADTERASNHSGQLRGSQRRFARQIGQPGSRASIGFALMEHTAPEQDGTCGGIELLRDGQPVLFAGRAPAAAQFAVGPRHDVPVDAWHVTALPVAAKDDLFRTHYLRLVVEFGAQEDRAILECYSMYGLPTAEPVTYCADDLSFDGLAIVLDDYQMDELTIGCEELQDRFPVHFRPTRLGRMADTIPFYWNGEYHIFYLRAVGKVPWEHVVSRDLVTWQERPTALWADGEETGPNGLNMFTGCVVEHAGVFHAFYVGWNHRNPAGREFIEHAVSKDLNTWTKLPNNELAPDGKLYADARERDFRDPHIWLETEANLFHMVFCSGRETGTASSHDLIHWEFEPPLASNYDGLGTPECPDLFPIGAKTYLLTSPIDLKCTIARVADSWRGPYADVVGRAIDTPFLYAAKRMWDGKRHVLTGWIRDLAEQQDRGAFLWGGTQCVPREAYVIDDPRDLRFRPVPEAVAVYATVLHDMSDMVPSVSQDAGWHSDADGHLRGEAPNGTRSLTCAPPPNYLFTCRLTPSRDARLRFVFRSQVPDARVFGASLAAATSVDSVGAGYTLELVENHAELRGAFFQSGREVVLPFGRPLTLTVFVQGSILECFVDDAYAFSCRAYDYRDGELKLDLVAGEVEIEQWQVRVPRR